MIINSFSMQCNALECEMFNMQKKREKRREKRREDEK